MNTKYLTILAAGTLFLFTTISFGQSIKSTNGDREKAYPQLDVNTVPAEVKVKFAEAYPVTSYEVWYGYPTFANESDWYCYDPNLYSDKYPEFYIVQFMQNNSPHKAIFYQTGNRISTYRRLNADSPVTLPETVSEVLRKGAYKNWNVITDSEELIVRDSNMMKVYRIEIENGNTTHFLYFDADGTILKDMVN